MNVSYIRLVGPEWMTGALKTTTGKDMYKISEPSLEMWKMMLVSAGGTGHSPLRSVLYRVYVEDVPSWVSVHYVRHHIGVQFYVKAQRSNPNRANAPQGELVNMMFDINAQALINVAKARTCLKAAKETREVMSLLRQKMLEDDDYDSMLAQVMVPSCEWYSGTCFEPRSCGKVKAL